MIEEQIEIYYQVEVHTEISGKLTLSIDNVGGGTIQLELGDDIYRYNHYGQALRIKRIFEKMISKKEVITCIDSNYYHLINFKNILFQDDITVNVKKVELITTTKETYL